MLNRLSVKVGLLFFVFILTIELLLYSVLYANLTNERINEVMNNLLIRGNTHRDVLEDHFDSSTLQHVGMMETASDFIVVITDESGNVTVHSDPLEPEMMQVIEHADSSGTVSAEGEIVEDQWEDSRYIATDSPITIDDQHAGHVFMFASTAAVKQNIQYLREQFLIIGIITFLSTIIAISILSRFITTPLIRIKEATKQMGQGNNNIELFTGRKDELGELANSIMEVSADLDRLKKERNDFLASISHELRTPLAYIKGYADIISRPETSEEEKEEYIAIIREETEQLNVLIRNLFELARMDENKFIINQQLVPLKPLFENVGDLVRPLFEREGIPFSADCCEDIQVYVDPERFQQVLLNILDNAKKHVSSGERVAITAAQDGKFVKITVTDEGEGIPEEHIPYLFDRLYRVEKSRSRKSGGSGLGLAIAKEIIESHDGTIEVQSQRGKGTRVIIMVKGEPAIEKSAAGR